MTGPDPDGPRPAGWSAEEWTVWRGLHDGRTRRSLAAEVDRSTGLLSRWVARWRAEYGDDLFRDQAVVNRLGLSLDASRIDWGPALAPMDAAAELDALGDLTRRGMVELVGSILSDPRRVRRAAAADLRALATVHQRATADAAALRTAVAAPPPEPPADEPTDLEEARAHVMDLVRRWKAGEWPPPDWTPPVRTPEEQAESDAIMADIRGHIASIERSNALAAEADAMRRRLFGPPDADPDPEPPPPTPVAEPDGWGWP